jgi:GNAT superfamily N-acetyltransferase
MEIVRITAGTRKQASKILASAFFDYPMFVHYFPDVEFRRRRLAWYMGLALKCAMFYGEAYITDDGSGVLFFLPPKHTRLYMKNYIRVGIAHTPLILGLKTYMHLDECEKYVADTQEKLLKGRSHYYLWALAVDPKAQRKGCGGMLQKLLLDRADKEKLPVYLETHNKDNVPYYEKFGFQLIHTETIPNHGLDFWCMLREPQIKTADHPE